MSTIISILILWGLLVFFNWGLCKVASDYDRHTKLTWRLLKERDKNERILDPEFKRKNSNLK
ncbi:hypothetical protein SU69_07470 [Thermosipho melanesiensis]|uniref:Uncharacterized protein n=1 Tax=Thermosipho melanesiensis TaxID=46541 RepID=A0ABN4V136_9BACT|nr:hypothetical protein [Thermosipho melanesiensis]APT74917.1 hypothetical protein BW47_07815 [Thermosipho melanesiensis]OOC36340.1 hypothetical protein SU68_07540 [Thermosipho melanesiensis]OOC37158.1 hypothetical protein SU69_07470 [Thermosipho melanesiensis]OOC37910.1 hypothetical protein SU70_07480 [Thermosipho melanesiensis]OOC41137.1 hypothetical protein SU71_07460 [Thermosipho melanesiensis]